MFPTHWIEEGKRVSSSSGEIKNSSFVQSKKQSTGQRAKKKVTTKKKIREEESKTTKTHTRPLCERKGVRGVVFRRIKLPQQSRERTREREEEEEEEEESRAMILLLVVGEKSAYKKESREREREREREAHRKATQSLWFHPLLKKNSPLFLQKLCVLLGEARTHKSKSPNLHRAPEFHSSSSLSTLRRKKPIKSTGI